MLQRSVLSCNGVFCVATRSLYLATACVCLCLVAGADPFPDESAAQLRVQKMAKRRAAAAERDQRSRLADLVGGPSAAHGSGDAVTIELH